MNVNHCSRWLLAALLALGGGLSPVAQAQPAGCDAIVGSDGACTHSNLNAGLLSAALSSSINVVCIANNHTETNVNKNLVNYDGAGSGALTLRGGYSNCSSAAPSGTTALPGNGADPVFSISASAGRQSIVTFENLSMSSGSPGIEATTGARVTLNRVIVAGNDLGIEMRDGAEVTTDISSQISSNISSGTGGGIFCFNSTLTTASLIQGNQINTSSGGGIYAANCTVTLNEGTWISGNSAASGGGMQANQGSVVRGGGTGALGVRIFNNHAVGTSGSSGFGGGLLVTADADVRLANTRIESNTATQAGGGAYVSLGGQLQLERYNALPCPSPPRCATLSGNRLTLGTSGSAVMVSGDGSRFRMMQGYIENNGPDVGQQELIVSRFANAGVELDGVQLWNNRASTVLLADDSASLVAGFVSAARNGYRLTMGGSVIDAVPARTTNSGSVILQSSIFADHVAFDGASGSLTARCLLAETSAGIDPPIGASEFGLDPLFTNAASGDLHLTASSPAIDYCDNSTYTPLDSDYDLDPRGQNNVVPDVFGPYDLGVDEYTGPPPPMGGDIFADGFES